MLANTLAGDSYGRKSAAKQFIPHLEKWLDHAFSDGFKNLSFSSENHGYDSVFGFKELFGPKSGIMVYLVSAASEMRSALQKFQHLRGVNQGPGSQIREIALGRLLLGLFSPQGPGKKIHPWLEDLGNCPVKDIVNAAIYAWATKPGDNIQIQLMVPAEATDGGTFDALWEWLLRIDPNSPGEITNLLVLFMKLVATRKLL
ncbi:hypothetical protein B0H19DRAFT_1346064 [Mycena capillaripes]|nr:hypothetical protein B0H19DRAFT_1346064 [Mycena capillaripes]